MRAGAVTLPATYTPANEQTWSWRSVVYQNGRAAYLVHYMAPGASSRNISNCFATSSTVWKLTPVAFPPGRARVATRPAPTGSDTYTKTIGIVRIFACNALTAGVVLAKMTSGLSATISWARPAFSSDQIGAKTMAREELKWQNIDADDLPAEVKKSFDAMVEAEAAFKADLEKLLKNEGHMPEDKYLLMSRKGKRLGVAYASTPRGEV